MIKLVSTHLSLLVFILLVGKGYAQDEQDSALANEDLGTVTDSFQENFFEALKQKGIENYELALNALKKAEKASKSNPSSLAIVYFERGKNLYQLKRYDEAEASLKEVLTIKGDKMEVLEALYDVYFKKRQYQEAIPIVQKLAKKDTDYKEDLANLYSKTKQFDKAIELLDELDAMWGESNYRNALRKQVYKISGNSEGAINNLESRIEKNPKNEKDYLNLIFLYSEQGDSNKAFETAKELLQNNPSSKKVHLALYKYYLQEGNIAQAVNSIKTIISSAEIPSVSKYEVFGDFLSFSSQNPSYETELQEIITLLGNSDQGEFYEQLGGFFNAKGNKEKALSFYEKGVALDPDNFSLLKNTILLQIDTQKFQNAAQLSEEALAIFPAQPLLYLLNGVAQNEMNAPNKAIESLEMGIDFLLDDPKMERDFFLQLSRAHQLKGDRQKAKEYENQAAKIQIAN